MEGNGRIGTMWDRFYAENWIDRIPNRNEPGVVLALYTDYDADGNGAYSFAVGVRVGDAGVVPPGLTAYFVPAGKYAVFTSPRGPIPPIVFDIWKEIWSSDIDRAYRADFEIHDARSRDRNNAQIDVWISVK